MSTSTATDTPTPTPAPHPTAAPGHEGHGHAKAKFPVLALAALGVVFGDIGTSPLYTLKECLGGKELAEALKVAGPVERAALVAALHNDINGILSLIFWSLTMVVTVKYLTFIMRADNKGEGGIFALLGIVPERLRRKPQGHGAVTWVSLLVVAGAALLYGDGAITPAISVLSAVEGLKDARPVLEPAVLPITCVILFGLFLIQSRGTGTIGKLFGPVMLVWFGTIATLGALQIWHHPGVLHAVSPHHAVRYFADHGPVGLLILGAVVLAVTGGEALYADMGHFGLKPIRAVWLVIVFPSLLLCYFGQGALLLEQPDAVKNPFFNLVPTEGMKFALVLLSSAATIIASQALISGAFSLTRQAMQLGYFPRLTIKHTAHDTEGQIYVPEINWALAVSCILLVLSFRASERLASAYGIAVTGTMGITSIVFYVVARETWGWSRARALPLLMLFLAFDVPFFCANVFKLLDGGWVPVMIGVVLVAAMLIWSKGRTLVLEQFNERFPTLDEAIPLIRARVIGVTPGTAIFLSRSTTHVPPILMRQVQHLRVVHQFVVLLNIRTADAPTVEDADRIQVAPIDAQFCRVTASYGFMERPDVPDILAMVRARGGAAYLTDEITYFLGREHILGKDTGRMGRIAETLYAILSRNAVSADRDFNIPPDQTIEIGTQIDL